MCQGEEIPDVPTALSPEAGPLLCLHRAGILRTPGTPFVPQPTGPRLLGRVEGLPDQNPIVIRIVGGDGKEGARNGWEVRKVLRVGRWLGLCGVLIGHRVWDFDRHRLRIQVGIRIIGDEAEAVDVLDLLVVHEIPIRVALLQILPNPFPGPLVVVDRDAPGSDTNLESSAAR